MIDKILIKSFRLFEDLELGNLPHVNLIAGANNTGKTALLEAIFFALAGSEETCRGFPSAFRGSTGEPSDDFLNFWNWLPTRNPRGPLATAIMKGLDPVSDRELEVKASLDSASYAVKLGQTWPGVLHYQFLNNGQPSGRCVVSRTNRTSAEFSGASDPSVRLSVPPVTVFSTNPTKPSDLAEHFNRAQLRRGGTQRLVQALKVIEPRLSDLKYAKLGEQALVYAEIRLDDFIPVTQLGEGFIRLLTIFSEVLAGSSSVSGPGMVLIDEIENGIHYSVLPQIWKGLGELAYRENVQIFATTHSYECIRAAHEAFSSLDAYDLAVHRLDWAEGRVKAVTYNRVTLGTSMEMNLEVR